MRVKMFVLDVNMTISMLNNKKICFLSSNIYHYTTYFYFRFNFEFIIYFLSKYDLFNLIYIHIYYFLPCHLLFNLNYKNIMVMIYFFGLDYISLKIKMNIIINYFIFYCYNYLPIYRIIFGNLEKTICEYNNIIIIKFIAIKCWKYFRNIIIVYLRKNKSIHFMICLMKSLLFVVYCMRNETY